MSFSVIAANYRMIAFHVRYLHVVLTVSKSGAGDMKERYTRDRSGCWRKENRARFIKVPLVNAPPFYYMLNVDLGIRDGVRTSRGALSRHSPHAGHCYPPSPLSNVSTFSSLSLTLCAFLSLFPSYPFDSCSSPKHPRMHSCCGTPKPRAFSVN